MKGIAVVILALTAFVFLPVMPATAENNLLGQVAATGKAEVMVPGDSWSPIGKSYPVFAQSRYRTAKGRLSFVMKDGARIEMAEQSESVIKGSVGDYSVKFEKGSMAYNVPEGCSLGIETSNFAIEVIPGSPTIGGLSYEGENLHVVSISGKQSITTLSGERVMDLMAGSAVITPEGKILQAEATIAGFGDLASIGSVAGSAVSAGIGSKILPGALAVGGAAAVAAGISDDEGTASPASP